MDNLKKIRKVAEDIVKQRQIKYSDLKPNEIEKLIHNFEVQKVELEMQNDELRNTMLQLEISKQEFVDFFQFVPVGYIIVDENSQIIMSNQYINQLLLNENADLKSSSSFTDFIEIEDQDRYYLCKRLAFQKKKKQATDIRIINYDKKSIWVHIECFYDIAKEKYLISINDISENKNREAYLNSLIETTKTILETSDFEQTATSIFNACKESMGAKAGYVALLSENGDENELLFLDDGGMPCSVDPNLGMPIRGLRAEAYKSGEVTYDNNFMNSENAKILPEGHMDMPNVLFAPLNINNKTVGIMGFAFKKGGFTEKDKTIATIYGDYAAIALLNSKNYQKLKEQNSELEILNTAKDKIMSIIGHDIKNPISAAYSFSQLIDKENSSNPNIHKYNKIIQESSKQAIQLLEELLKWAITKVSANSFAPKMFNLKDFMDSVIGYIGSKAEEKNIHLVYSIENDISVYADEHMLHSVLRNLISNAIKYSFSGQKVQINISERATDILFIVKDKGTGIKKENIEVILEGNENFYTLGTNNEKGTGLGLRIVKDFISRHKGDFYIQSKEGKGSEFCFTLPKLSEQKQEVRSSDLETKPTILIVDDDPGNCELIEALYNNNDYAYEISYNGLDAVNKCKNNNCICLVVMDIMMQVMSGDKATKEIKKIKPDLPVIGCSANNLKKSEISEIGFDSFINKPIYREVLIKETRKYVSII